MNPRSSNFIMAGSLFAFAAVGLGAFGAHFLKNRLSSEFLEIFHAGVSYQFYHALALLAFGLLAENRPCFRPWPGYAFIFGIVVFSGSLYLLAFTQIRILGAITPIGGVAFLVGWIGFALESRPTKI